MRSDERRLTQERAQRRELNNVAQAGGLRSRAAQAIVDDIGHYRQQGLQHFLIGADGHDLDGTLALLEQFATEVMAKCD